MTILSESFTDIGLRAAVNQDSIYDKVGQRLSVFCVADGMGGHQHGELASQTIVSNLGVWQQTEEQRTEKSDFPGLLDRFEEMIDKVNRLIFAEYNQSGICGSTLVALLLYGGHYAAFSAGDSRIYRKRRFSFEQLLSDDVWENQPEIAGAMSEEEMRAHPSYGKLTRAVGVADHLSLNRVTGDLKRGDIFFLCSDGVYKYTDEKKVRRLITRQDVLKQEVIRGGAPDNYSMITVRIKR